MADTNLQKQQLVEAFQERITEIVEKVDPDFFPDLNSELESKNLPFKFEVIRKLGTVVFLLEETDDKNFFDKFKIINQYDLYPAGAIVQNVFLTASVADLIKTYKILVDLERCIDEFNVRINAQLEKVTKLFKKK